MERGTTQALTVAPSTSGTQASADYPSTSSTQAPAATSTGTLDLTDSTPKLKRRRIKNDAFFKAEFLAKKTEGLSNTEIIATCKSFNVDMSKISKWNNDKDNIIKAAGDQQKKKLFKIRPALKYKELYQDLKTKFVELRLNGQYLDFNCLWSMGRNIYCAQMNDLSAVLKKHVIANFIKQQYLRIRKIQRNKRL